MIGIVGNGFVGNAVYQNFRDKTQCKVYDTDKNRSLNSLGEVINQEFIFVCLPTPMRYGGECDLSILDNFFEGLPDHITGTFVIKSTVPVGTTKRYYERHNVIHNPEFLTARNAIKDFANSERNIVGADMDLCVDFVTMFEKYLIASLSSEVVMMLGISGKNFSNIATKSTQRSMSPPTIFLSELAKSLIAFLAVRNSGL